MTANYATQAQCCTNKNPKPDYCFNTTQTPDKCAAFYEKESNFYFYADKKAKEMTLAIPATTDLVGLLPLVQKEKKLTAEDILFIQAALEKWKIEKTNIGYTFTESGLGYKVLTKGTGPKPTKGNNVTVHYKGTLLDGTVFDSSFDRGQPATFPIGVGQLIKGWDEGIPMFEEGSRIMLKIPPQLGYGNRATGKIPANATLLFEIEIIKAH
jgi:hypothetical protein